MVAAFACCGNPSSVHAEGRAARALVEAAREKVAALAGARPEEVIFTSGGSEANALALAAQAGHAWQCYLSAVEHPSVLAGGRFYPESTTRIPVTKDGVVDLEVLARELAKHHLGGWRPFVSLMAANNETGAIQPVAEAADLVHAADGLLHSDAVQLAGKLKIDFDGAWRRHDQPVGAQDWRSQGCWRADPARRRVGRAPDQGRRPGAEAPRRHRECRRHRWLRRRRRVGGGGGRSGGRGGGASRRARAPGSRRRAGCRGVLERGAALAEYELRSRFPARAPRRW